MKKLMIAIIATLISLNIHAKTIRDTDTVSLEGTIQMKTGYGPPNYGEDPKHDMKIKYRILKLKKAINFEDTQGLGDSASNVKNMQILWSSDNTQKLPNSGCVIITGNLFAAHTAHHKTPVLIDGTSFKPCN